MIGPGIVIPLVMVVVLVPLGVVVARRRLRPAPGDSGHDASGARLTGSALRGAATPPWRVVFEVAPDRLDGIEHVLIGPAGIFAVRTAMAPLPDPTSPEPADATPAQLTARAAIARTRLDEVVTRCGASSTALVTVHWSRSQPGEPVVELAHGHLAVDGHRLGTWIGSLPGDHLTPAQIDLAWRTVTTGIGRPEPR